MTFVGRQLIGTPTGVGVSDLSVQIPDSRNSSE
jgi:hypothetical protein